MTSRAPIKPRRAAAALCAVAALMVLLCSVHLFVGWRARWGAAVLLLVGLGLVAGR